MSKFIKTLFFMKFLSVLTLNSMLEDDYRSKDENCDLQEYIKSNTVEFWITNENGSEYFLEWDLYRQFDEKLIDLTKLLLAKNLNGQIISPKNQHIKFKMVFKGMHKDLFSFLFNSLSSIYSFIRSHKSEIDDIEKFKNDFFACIVKSIPADKVETEEFGAFIIDYAVKLQRSKFENICLSQKDVVDKLSKFLKTTKKKYQDAYHDYNHGSYILGITTLSVFVIFIFALSCIVSKICADQNYAISSGLIELSLLIAFVFMKFLATKNRNNYEKLLEHHWSDLIKYKDLIAVDDQEDQEQYFSDDKYCSLFRKKIERLRNPTTVTILD